MGLNKPRIPSKRGNYSLVRWMYLSKQSYVLCSQVDAPAAMSCMALVAQPRSSVKCYFPESSLWCFEVPEKVCEHLNGNEPSLRG